MSHLFVQHRFRTGKINARQVAYADGERIGPVPVTVRQ